MDWTCECGTLNPDGTKFCNQCGAPRPPVHPPRNTPSVPAAPPKESEAKAIPSPEPPQSGPGGPSAGSTGPSGAGSVSRTAPAAVPPPAGQGVPKKKGKGCLLWAVVILAVLLVFCLIAAAVGYFVVWPKLKGSNRIKQATAVAEMTKISVALEGYKTSSGAYPSPGHNPDSYYSIVDLGKLAPQLTPVYLKTVPLDPWGHPYQYGTSPDDGSYVLICTGSDGVNSLEQIPSEPKDTHCYEDEIVLEKGTFVQKPGGEQEACSKVG